MSNISVRVELPGHSHSFIVEVSPISSVGQIKAEISKRCVGGPRVEGMRLIYGGRLLKDEEMIQEIWVPLQDSVTVHLAVHPSAWTTNPPDRQAPTPAAPLLLAQTPFAPAYAAHSPAYTPLHSMEYPTHGPYHMSAFPSPIMSADRPHPFIVHKHESAIVALETNSCANIPIYSPSVTEIARRSAISSLATFGWSWPEIFDEPIPTSDSPGVKYERVILEGQSYLSLTTPELKPSALQIHALKTLSYTSTILLMPPSTPVSYNPYYPYSMPAHHPMPQAGLQNLNQHLQNLGIPPVRVAQNGIANAQIRVLPLRALMIPMIMLTLRTLLLVYFFAPSKTPLFGLIIAAWITYEAWNTVRAVLQPARARGEQRGAPPVPGANGVPGQPPNLQPQNAVAGAATPANTTRDHTSVVLDTLANINLSNENDALSATPARPVNQPSLAHKAQTFLTLLITTAHPALWNRRRAELMRREGRIRTESVALQAEDGNATPVEGDVAAEVERRAQARNELREQHARRPVWVREYVERVRNAEFADE